MSTQSCPQGVAAPHSSAAAPVDALLISGTHGVAAAAVRRIVRRIDAQTPQLVLLPPQTSPHCPSAQTSPSAQTCPQPPQFDASVAVCTHEPPQSVEPPTHSSAFTSLADHPLSAGVPAGAAMAHIVAGVDALTAAVAGATDALERTLTA